MSEIHVDRLLNVCDNKVYVYIIPTKQQKPPFGGFYYVETFTSFGNESSQSIENRNNEANGA